MEEPTLTALRRIAGVSTAFVVDAEGTAESEVARQGDLAAAQRALLAALVGAVNQAAGDLGLGGLSELIVETEDGAIIATSLPDGRAAVVLVQGQANLGLARVELRRLRRAA